MKNVKFVFVPDYYYNYWHTINNDLYEREEVFVSSESHNPIVRFAMKLHFSRKLNKHLLLPFQGIWLYKIIPRKYFTDEKQVFIFREGSIGFFSQSILKKIHRKAKNSVIILQLANPVNHYIENKLTLLKRNYDHVLTFNEYDANHYGLELQKKIFPYDGFLKYKRICKIKYDCFFVGANKGRLNKIISVYKRLRDLGFNCLFYITEVDPEEMMEGEGLIYNEFITYEKVLELIQESNCILEIVNGDYSSIRFHEAIAFGKKLLTTSKACKNEKLYNASQIKVFSDANDITKEFLDSPIESSVEGANTRDEYLNYYWRLEKRKVEG